MYTREYNYKSRKGVIRMDPDCAICHAPAALACECEAKGLEVAVRQAEARMMQSIYNDIRSWVRAHAQDYILEYFRLLTERRKTAHNQHVERLQAHAFHYYHSSPHPNEIAAAQAQLKRGIDEDWQASVQRYPEVLEYFYSLVELTLPDDNEPAVKDPPLSALNGPRKAARRVGAPTTVSGPSLTAHAGDMREMPLPRGRTPPPLEPLRERRTPAPRERRHSYRPPPPPQSTYFPPPY
ncbi:Serine/threonine protein phosphatase [Madurella fahalii]|uniref:Serine/threonine protein phosphatase n=1 Tax=Madurella fahalii TaxID=1157608 RepID=A0ABQ0GLZ5_9PEZI